VAQTVPHLQTELGKLVMAPQSEQAFLLVSLFVAQLALLAFLVLMQAVLPAGQIQAR
jgi:hypothetical protein